ncbi:auxin-responsive protein SAUR68-like [Carica papaya]|uniref:auxin-responsive protein SAUR68-like n=1 Tax=Carica papaya TaxID=3649 RepID=UPI000B8C756E|nr:auxin-responsive protein SAUR68-like [Carica papaya]
MISTKKLIKMARKWQRIAALKKKRISLPRESNGSNMPPVADKGHFVVYLADQTRFIFPITYLNNPVIRELFEISKEEFGLPSDGPITLPCDAVFMEYVIYLIKRNAAKDVETTFLMSMATGHWLPILSFNVEQSSQQSLICGF